MVLLAAISILFALHGVAAFGLGEYPWLVTAYASVLSIVSGVASVGVHRWRRRLNLPAWQPGPPRF